MKIAEIFDTMEYGPAPESNDIALDWIKSHGGKFKLFVNGDWTEPNTQNWFKTINPANSTSLAQIAAADETDINAAVTAARKAQKSWDKIGGHGRARYLYSLARAIQRNARLLAVLESMDNGKPVRETRDIDIPLVV
ncbi:MAG: aldehyde dehydrogenase family protein, partial [Sneathiella sp.]|nr:aldehyde dehydrogenase family protein [Sneathiella sp.]